MRVLLMIRCNPFVMKGFVGLYCVIARYYFPSENAQKLNELSSSIGSQPGSAVDRRLYFSFANLLGKAHKDGGKEGPKALEAPGANP